jgi:hypothetical protein
MSDSTSQECRTILSQAVNLKAVTVTYGIVGDNCVSSLIKESKKLDVSDILFWVVSFRYAMSDTFCKNFNFCRTKCRTNCRIRHWHC